MSQVKNPLFSNSTFPGAPTLEPLGSLSLDCTTHTNEKVLYYSLRNKMFYCQTCYEELETEENDLARIEDVIRYYQCKINYGYIQILSQKIANALLQLQNYKSMLSNVRNERV